MIDPPVADIPPASAAIVGRTIRRCVSILTGGRQAGAAFAAALTLLAGCTLFQSGKEDSTALKGSSSTQVAQRIREAKAQNSVVIQVADDSVPIRVLPLPADGESVFVSDLLTQTGVAEKLGRMQATLYRANPSTPMGVPMEVRFSPKDGSVRPECDYALQPGDRLKIMKDETSMIGGLIDQLLPSNGARALRGY